jgi:acyl-coenzyme A thioesterase PaaI-like protein
MNDLKDWSQLRVMIKENRWSEVANYFNTSEQVCHFGFTVNLENNQQPICSVHQVENYHLGGIGQSYVNGAIIAALADLAIGLTGLKFIVSRLIATSELVIQYKKPLVAKPFYAKSEIENTEGNRLIAICNVYNHLDEVCVIVKGNVRINL